MTFKYKKAKRKKMVTKGAQKLLAGKMLIDILVYGWNYSVIFPH